MNLNPILLNKIKRPSPEKVVISPPKVNTEPIQPDKPPVKQHAIDDSNEKVKKVETRLNIQTSPNAVENSPNKDQP